MVICSTCGLTDAGLNSIESVGQPGLQLALGLTVPSNEKGNKIMTHAVEMILCQMDTVAKN